MLGVAITCLIHDTTNDGMKRQQSKAKKQQHYRHANQKRRTQGGPAHTPIPRSDRGGTHCVHVYFMRIHLIFLSLESHDTCTKINAGKADIPPPPSRPSSLHPLSPRGPAGLASMSVPTAQAKTKTLWQIRLLCYHNPTIRSDGWGLCIIHGWGSGGVL